MPGVAVPWEAAAEPAASITSLAVLRTGVVLQRDSPALDRMSGLTRWGLGGRMGDGRQWTTWLHIGDFLRAVDALADPSTEAGRLTGPVHVCAPEPCTNDQLMAALRHACRRPSWAPPSPRWAIRLGAPLMGSDATLALTGRRCIPRRLTDAGFTFRHPHIDEALADLID
jgi:NAD dependent epimerase/dehydratase family enzyme